MIVICFTPPPPSYPSQPPSSTSSPYPPPPPSPSPPISINCLLHCLLVWSILSNHSECRLKWSFWSLNCRLPPPHPIHLYHPHSPYWVWDLHLAYLLLLGKSRMLRWLISYFKDIYFIKFHILVCHWRWRVKELFLSCRRRVGDSTPTNRVTSTIPESKKHD